MLRLVFTLYLALRCLLLSPLLSSLRVLVFSFIWASRRVAGRRGECCSTRRTVSGNPITLAPSDWSTLPGPQWCVEPLRSWLYVKRQVEVGYTTAWPKDHTEASLCQMLSCVKRCGQPTRHEAKACVCALRNSLICLSALVCQLGRLMGSCDSRRLKTKKPGRTKLGTKASTPKIAEIQEQATLQGP